MRIVKKIIPITSVESKSINTWTTRTVYAIVTVNLYGWQRIGKRVK